MLSPRDDDDDDTHLCIKCNSTVVGLDNYVKHRKDRCGKKLESKDLPPIDTLDPTYSLGADMFFQSLELQSSVKKTALSRLTPPIPISKPSIDRKNSLPIASISRPQMSPLDTNLRGEDWIGGHTLRISGNEEDNQTKLINAVASISGAVKKDTNTSYTIGYNYKGDEESDESEVFEEDDEEDHSGGKWKPPVNYTGGKWRPGSPEHDWDDQEPTASWKTLLPEVDDNHDEDYDAPPPGHTKGKWVPGANEKTQIMQTTLQSKGSVQYWCGPCNRRLGSRGIYEKHLRSALHLKKIQPEQELEYSGHLKPMKVVEKRKLRSSKFLNDEIYSNVKRQKRQKGPSLSLKVDLKKRKRKTHFIHCAGCKSRVRTHLMGKHLISHYHFRKAAGVTDSLYQQLILDNITAIVHQSPFQCSPCKFYTNWLSTFMQHWRSDEHEWTMAFIEGIFWCSFCKFECETSQEMLEHLTSSDHTEVIAVINRSMPIIIRKKTVLKCETCNGVFRLNIELKKHSAKSGHRLSYTATDAYQELHQCEHCKAKFKTTQTLAAHLKSKHKQKAHLCLVCSKSFGSADAAKQHRQTTEHKVNRKEMLIRQGLITKDLRKKCPYCTEKVMLRNIIALKEHIRTFHPDIRKTCPKCGMEFILSQEVSTHIRARACRFQASARVDSSVFWSCSQCLFTTDSQAECYFHEVLHEPPFRSDGNEKYTCPFCQKYFKKTSLRLHLRQHTFERPFVCSVCRANFTRQTSLANHVRAEHGDTAKGPGVNAVTKPDHRCEKCGTRYPNKLALTRHVCIRALTGSDRKCTVEDCNFIASSALQLIKHHRIHGDSKALRHQCPHCPFRGSQASHLRRHLMCHKGDKPYACPHCDFTSGSLENLRKHALRSSRHKGVFLYLCKHCEYKCNLATELRLHLTAAHSALYDVKKAIQAAKVHLMKIESAEETSNELINEIPT